MEKLLLLSFKDATKSFSPLFYAKIFLMKRMWIIEVQKLQEKEKRRYPRSQVFIH